MKRVVMILFLVLIRLSALQGEELTIVTINVWSGLTYEGMLRMGEYESSNIRERRYSILVNQVRRLNPDIIALQEANKLPHYASRLARDLGMDRIYSVGLGGMRMGCLGIPTNLKEGDAILAKPEWQLKRVRAVRLSGKGIISDVVSFHFSESNQAIVGKVVCDNSPIYIINVHTHAGMEKDVYWSERMDFWLDSGKYSSMERRDAVHSIYKDVQRRQTEVRRLLGWISRALPPDAPVILMGDFNASPDQPEIRWIGGNGFLDTYSAVNYAGIPGYTWNPNKNLNIQQHYLLSPPDSNLTLIQRLRQENQQRAKRIDYIFIRPGQMQIEILESRIVFNKTEEGHHPSDHFGVMTRIRWGDEG
ncbi:endonuclease/exonuclease/phosphatase family protein [bacterium]